MFCVINSDTNPVAFYYHGNGNMTQVKKKLTDKQNQSYDRDTLSLG